MDPGPREMDQGVCRSELGYSVAMLDGSRVLQHTESAAKVLRRVATLESRVWDHSSTVATRRGGCDCRFLRGLKPHGYPHLAATRPSFWQSPVRVEGAQPI